MLRRLIMLALIGALIAVIVNTLPDIKRYLQIRDM
jgi:hypothetical protein